MNLNQFAQWITNIGNNVEPATTAIVKEMGKAMAPVLIYGTPVDSGRARANWQGSNNRIPSNMLYYPHPLAPASPGDGAREGLTSMDNAVAAYTGKGFYAFTNNVEYIEELNNGYSRQAPAGFVEQAVLTGILSLNGKTIVVP